MARKYFFLSPDVALNKRHPDVDAPPRGSDNHFERTTVVDKTGTPIVVTDAGGTGARPLRNKEFVDNRRKLESQIRHARSGAPLPKA
jgi:hypothetical protein